MTRSAVLGYLVPLIVVADVATAILSVYKAPFPLHVELGAPTAYLSIYVHVPLAWASYLLFTTAMLGVALYLWKGRDVFERVTGYAVLLGVIYGFGTIVTGMAWAEESWGAAWSWDPRETGVLFLLLAYLGYFAVRSSVRDPEKKKTLSSAYAVAAYTAVPLSFLSAYIGGSLHPTSSQTGGFLGGPGVAVYFAARVLLASATALGLLALLVAGVGGRYAAYAGALVLIMGVVAAGILVYPYFSSTPLRVVNATLLDDRITAIETQEGMITFNPPAESPVNPALAGGRPTIIGHLVVVERDSLTLLVHWSAAFALAVYSIIVGGVLLLLHKPIINI